MFLFQPEHIEAIHNGSKTETRRIWKKPRAKVGAIHLIKTQMLSKVNYGSIKILDVRQKHLLDITEEDARAEGGYTRQEYLALWFRINPKSPPNPKLYVISFEFIKEIRGGII